MRGPLIGRAAELGAIQDTIARSLRQGSPAAMLVIGEPGSGKSHLLAEAVSRARPEVRLDVTGSQPERDVPLSAIRVQLGRLKGERTGTGLRILLGQGPEAAQPLEPIRLFEAVHAALDGRRVVLAVDDLQVVDSLTVALLHFLIRAAATQRQALTLVAVSRQTQAAHAFADALDAVLRSDPIERLELRPLDRESGAALAQRVDARARPCNREQNVSDACRRVPILDRSSGPRRRTRAAMPPRSSLSASGASRPTLASCWARWRCSVGPSSRWRYAGSSAGARTDWPRRSLNSRLPHSSPLPMAGSGSRTT